MDRNSTATLQSLEESNSQRDIYGISRPNSNLPEKIDSKEPEEIKLEKSERAPENQPNDFFISENSEKEYLTMNAKMLNINECSESIENSVIRNSHPQHFDDLQLTDMHNSREQS